MNSRYLIVLTVLLGTAFARPLQGRAELLPPRPAAINIDGGSGEVKLALSSPPAADYTLGAWVYLRSGGAFSLTRLAVLSASNCGDSAELLIRANSDDPTSPQYLELARCGHFNGAPSTSPVPLNTWAHVAVTVSSAQTVSYFINGLPAGTWDATGLDLSLGIAVNLGDNSGLRHFDGMLDEVQIWTRALTPSEIQTQWDRSLTGTEPGLYAYYRFNEGTGTTASDSAPAGGALPGTLADGATWVGTGAPLTPSVKLNYSGGQTNLGVGWRSYFIAKAADLDGDQIIGSDGYHLVNLDPALPSYVDATEILTSIYPGNGDYASIDDPASPGLSFITGTMNPSVATGSSTDLFRFALNSKAVGRTIRVGFLVDNLDGANWNASSLTLAQANGLNPKSAEVPTTDPALNDRRPDWLFFDISGAQAGDAFVIRGRGGINGAATLGGVVFDSVGTAGGPISISVAGRVFPYPSHATAPVPPEPPFTMTLNLDRVSTPFQGLGLLMVGPGGQKIRPVSSAYGGFDTSKGAMITLEDFATASLPFTFEGEIPSGTYRPDTDQSVPDLPSPAPPGPYSGVLGSALTGELQGLWSLYADGSSVEIRGWSVSFPMLPATTTLPASAVASDHALLNARVRPGTGIATLYFEYGPSTNYGLRTTGVALAAGAIPVVTSSVATGLDPAMLHHFRAVGTNAHGVIAGEDLTFTTLPAAPRVATLAPTAFVGSGVTLNGTANPLGIEGVAWFEWGATPAFGQSTVPVSLGQARNDVPLSAPIANLSSAMPYYFRSVASNAVGVIYGTTVSFVAPTTQVANTNDSGPGSLRQAIADAAPGGVITFVGVSGVIPLTGGELLIKKSVTIVGPTDAQVTLSGRNSSRIFNIASGAICSLSNLTMRDGHAPNAGVFETVGGDGGGIWNAGTLLLTGCTITGNQAGVGGGRGGGIFNQGVVTLDRCTIVGNSSAKGIGSSFFWQAGVGGAGGGLFSSGTATVVACTISQNKAGDGGAGGSLFGGGQAPAGTGGSGGGIFSVGSISLRNVLVGGNEVGAGSSPGYGPDLAGSFESLGHNLARVVDGSAGLTNGLSGDLAGTGAKPLEPLLGPLADNGGATWTMLPLAASPAYGAGDDSLTGFDQRGPGFPRRVGTQVDIGAVEAVADELPTVAVSETGVANGRAILHGTVNQLRSSTLVWFEWGITTSYGQSTPPQTFAARLLSPRVDATLSGLNPDQTYRFRLVASNQFGVVFSDDQTFLPHSRRVTTADDSGPGSLRERLALGADGDVIEFDVPVDSITLTSGELTLSARLTVKGPGAGKLSISGGQLGRVFHISQGATGDISGLTIRDGLAPGSGDGGGILNHGTLTLSECLLIGNRAGAGQAGSPGKPGSGDLFANETPGGTGGAGGHGGAIQNLGTLVVRGCTFVGNTAGPGGVGGVGGNVSNSDIAPSVGGMGGPGGFGGAIFNAGLLQITASTLTTNHAGMGGLGGQGGAGPSGASGGAGGPGGFGGGIYNTGHLIGQACTLGGNEAGRGGGGEVGGARLGPGLFTTHGASGGGGVGGNAGGIFNAGTASIQNMLVDANSPGAGGPGGPAIVNAFFVVVPAGPNGPPGGAPDMAGEYVSLGHNLVGNADTALGLTNGMSGDLVGSASAPIHSLLGPLTDNGGPTPTLALLPGSPALDTGDDSLTGFDQRGDGFPRRARAHVDIGAFEAASTVPELVIQTTLSGANLSWDPSFTGWVLQQNSTLVPVGWVDVPSGSLNPAPVDLKAPIKFYRLIKR